MSSPNSTREKSFNEDNVNLIHNNNNNEEFIQAKQFTIPNNLKKTFRCVIILTILGIILLIFGIEDLIRTEELKTFICLSVLSLLVLIPGLFYLFQFYKACKEKDENKRNEILNDIPIMDN